MQLFSNWEFAVSKIREHLEIIAPVRGNLIEGLQQIQEQEGYISDNAIKACAEHFGMPEVDVEGVVTFYAYFKRNKPGKYHITVCDGTACHIKGAPLIMEWISNELGISGGETDGEGMFSMETVACMGCCSLAPVMSINGRIYGNLDRKQLLRILKGYQKED